MKEQVVEKWSSGSEPTNDEGTEKSVLSVLLSFLSSLSLNRSPFKKLLKEEPH